jgi:predicted small lipoprotein YifL
MGAKGPLYLSSSAVEQGVQLSTSSVEQGDSDKVAKPNQKAADASRRR